MQNNYAMDQLKIKYLEADFKYRTNVLPTEEFNVIVNEILNELLVTCDSIQPYYDYLKECAEEQWLKMKKVAPYFKARYETRPKLNIKGGVEELRKEFLVEDMNYRKGAISMFNHNRFLSDIISQLIIATGSIEPYFSNMEKEANELWKKTPEYKKLLLSQF